MTTAENVLIIQPWGGDLDGRVLPVARVLTWRIDAPFNDDEIAAGYDRDEWVPGTRCLDLTTGVLYEYVEGFTWACVLEERI